MSNIHLKFFFPMTTDRNVFRKIQFDKESLHYISKRLDAEIITCIAVNHLKKFNITPDDVTLTDATAGIGGNTISFGMMFKNINTIELDPIRFKYLINNVDAYELSNITSYCGDCTNIIHIIPNQQIVFIDPPWGGKNYKLTQNMKITLSDKTLEDFCINIFDKAKTKYVPYMIILKLPLNYDISYLYEQLNVIDKIIYLYTLDKMYIVVIEEKCTRD